MSRPGPIRHAVITGASRGLGAAMARQLAAPGRRLSLIARGQAGLQATAAACEALGAEVAIGVQDVAEPAGLAALLAAWEAERPIDTLIANAGLSAGTTPEGRPEGPAAAAQVVAVNLLGAIHLVQPMLPALLARGEGRILLIGSVAGFLGLPDSAAYSAGKAGLWAYGEALRAAHGPAGLQVLVAAPGFFESAMSARYLGAHPLEVGVEAMAARILRALRAGRGRVVTPWPLGALLRGLALLPPPLADALVRLGRFRIAPE
ncbi:SDR family NAD(P)-dependent oxidoreductase [Siccirubricoccus sp. KC 17139]|uniref:SDR family NAD(P)-dependent oxidoreductase n=1 Tax=Siccirubricoccus soli TaxID=2899147 RepID=A0ABT1D2B9_9PROT|nr:SDR family NAD(P)-dependent oxidoreductase [Siccirubricoccus soli]MCO6416060.1 SDR family NAD(P)-dependent oxidoreductase [Siccirubricoccus soli]MCP2682192.1 SDR family NAD(P)-dependent oxidoreductase [Siccirubricoccus soli]